MTQSDGATKIKRFKKEAFPKVVVSVNMLDTGFDFPEIVNLVMARFTKSSILYQQMRGRGTRKSEVIRKPLFTMFDFVGVSDFHGDEEGGGEGGFVVNKPPGPQPPKPRSLLVIDVHDHIDPTTRAWITVDADGNEVRADPAMARASELGVRFEAWLLDHPGFTPEQMRWLSVIGEQIKANAGYSGQLRAGSARRPSFQLYGRPRQGHHAVRRRRRVGSDPQRAEQQRVPYRPSSRRKPLREPIHPTA